eukprot:5334961-Pyramimonas_sp.AAC.1
MKTTLKNQHLPYAHHSPEADYNRCLVWVDPRTGTAASVARMASLPESVIRRAAVKAAELEQKKAASRAGASQADVVAESSVPNDKDASAMDGDGESNDGSASRQEPW